MSNFITNSRTNSLKKRITELISKSTELKFLVGFFYFSGIKELYEGLKTNPNVQLKVLVGLNVDILNQKLIEFDESFFRSNNEKTDNFFSSIKKSLNTDIFDNKEFYEQIQFFVKLIQDNRLIIRKTYRPNHSKLYIFQLEENQVGRRTLFITGSSNLTYAGITGQDEFNVEISDYGIEEAKKYFDELWENAVQITEAIETKRKLIALLENETFLKQFTPFEAYALVLKSYLDSFTGKKISESLQEILVQNNYVPYKYQLDAVQQAIGIIEKNNGLIIADVVGLGKTIVALMIARELKETGLVLCPPGLIGDNNRTSGWKKYLADFKLFDWEVRSIGELSNDELTQYVAKREDIKIIIIDEAHRFRNQDTKSYEQVKNICRNKIVILLTATPFNNRPGDILSLLKLFVIPKKSSITLENNLVDKFKIFKGTFDRLGYIRKYWNSSSPEKREKALKYYQTFFESSSIDLTKIKQRAKYLAKQIRDVIEPVTIRRNRLDLKKNPYYKQEIQNLIEIENPQEWYFTLTKEQSRFYDTIIGEYLANPEEGGLFKGAIYHPFEYEIDKEKIEKKLSEEENRQYQQQRNLYDFMRRLLVKRFESSFGSFKKSVENFIATMKVCLNFIEKTKKFILDRNLLEKIYTLELDDIELYLQDYAQKIKEGVYPKNHKIYQINKFKYKNDFLDDITRDLQLFQKILKKLNDLELVHNDPKIECLITNLKEVKRKVIIFSEYKDTVKYLSPILNQYFNNRVLTISDNLSEHRIKEINKNFDASFSENEDKYDILLCTDKISEGFNLNRAGMVINYDIPWNPVRVIQRVGRINRIGQKVFDKIYIVNFFPTEIGTQLVKSREIAANKMFLIHNTLGEDAKIFDIDEEPTASMLFERIQQNPDNMESESFYTKILNEYEAIKENYPDVFKTIQKSPIRVKVAKHSDENELFVFIKKGRLYIQNVKYKKKPIIQSLVLDEVLEKIRCTKDEKGISLSSEFWTHYSLVKEFKEKTLPLPDLSLEQKALNNLKSFIRSNNEQIKKFQKFMRILTEDILEYGTLSDYTLRRIGRLEYGDDKHIKNTVEELRKLQNELGENYLLKEKEKYQKLNKEIIITIENQK